MKKFTFEVTDQDLARGILENTYPYTFLGDKNIERFISAWENYINIIEEPYKYSIARYIRILETRDLLERIKNKISAEGQNKLDEYLKIADNRYLNTTEVIDTPIRNGSHKNWWWYRIPLQFFESRDIQFFPSLRFDRDDREIIDKMVSGKDLPERRIDKKISNWINFVIRVKYNYQLDIFNYNHSLFGREALENLLKELSTSGIQQMKFVLTPTDEIFMNSTIPVSQQSSSFLGQFDHHSLWLNRLPLQMSDKLAKQFAAKGVFPKT